MRASSTLAFLVGGALGAAAVYLTCTEKGKQTLQKGLDFLDEKIKSAVGEEDANLKTEAE